MRSLASLALFALVLTPTAFAANSPLPEHVIAQSETSGGLMPPSMAPTFGVRIFDDGRVESYETSRDGRTVSAVLATLAMDRVAGIISKVKDLGPSELIRSDLSQNICYDGPSTSYRAVNAAGVVIDLAADSACLDYVRADGAWTVIPRLIQGLTALKAL